MIAKWVLFREVADDPAAEPELESGEEGTVYEYFVGTLEGRLSLGYDKERAALIVKAVNLHDALVAVNNTAVRFMDAYDETARNSNSKTQVALDVADLELRAALKAAGEKA